jgi:hypothetical protein
VLKKFGEAPDDWSGLYPPHGAVRRSFREALLVPWPASKKTTKQLINRNFMVFENREYH